jgi:APA family basic amino acid/polyamine antiporter
MAEDGIIPKELGHIHPRFKTPFAALLAQAFLGILYVLLGAFDTLLSSVVFAMLLANTATGIAHIKLRLERPEAPRPYKTHGYPLLPILFTLAHGAFAVTIAAENLKISLIGMGIALTALPFYFRQKHKR